MKNNSNTCKNCGFPLRESDKFCSECSARVVKNRISFRSILRDIWISARFEAFVKTLWHLLYKPQVMLKEYINGTRRKYAYPFAFFMLMMSFSVLFYTIFSEEFLQMTTDVGLGNSVSVEHISSSEDGIFKAFGYGSDIEFEIKMMQFYVKYYNYLSLILVPFYAFISLLIFRKPYNFWEQFIINMYLQGMTSIFCTLFLIISVVVGYDLFGYGSVGLSFAYYSFAYKKLYNLNWKQLLGKIAKFLGLMTVACIVGFLLLVAIVVNG
ncbi:MAG: DUF3667 domain-containing protein [Flavobacteriaceae bacterium]|nr:DUF3667 domain-containing protein [Flavobacteriaceae bacterium]